VAQPYILPLHDCDAAAVASVGGKCAHLGELMKGGLPVPPGFAVTTKAHDAFLGWGGLGAALGQLLARVDMRDVGAVQAASAAASALVTAAPVPKEVAVAIRDAYRALAEETGTAEPPVAVRSSAVAEDSAAASFAGQLETFLWVRGEDDVVRTVRLAWAGVYSAQALAYAAGAGLAAGEVATAVGVQRMVDARAAGVLFTLNPVNGDRSKIALEACLGLGEALVQGEVDPDRFLVDKVTLEVLERHVGGKAMEHRFDPAAGAVVSAAVAPERRSVAALSEEEVLELARLGKEIERLYGMPQDVEWAIGGPDRERVWLLQARPETVWSRKEAAAVASVQPSAVDYVLAGLLRGGNR
jgi:phosphoenolpyruvate synthase/pyruvate phosphate dikinase